MEFSNNIGDSESLWSAFENLEEIENVPESLDDLAIPDATYRQIKELNLALIDKARQLVESEKQIRRQREELELEKKNFESIRLQCSQDSTESRLGRLVRIDEAYRNGTPITDEQISDLVLKKSDMAATTEAEETQELTDLIEVEIDGLPTEDSAEEKIVFYPVPETVNDSASDVDQNAELERFQSSANNLKQKSEIISAIFIELDQVVRDLSRQQELLEELKLNHNQQSVTELDRVNDKLKRRFRRLSRQISTQPE